MVLMRHVSAHIQKAIIRLANRQRKIFYVNHCILLCIIRIYLKKIKLKIFPQNCNKNYAFKSHGFKIVKVRNAELVLPDVCVGFSLYFLTLRAFYI